MHHLWFIGYHIVHCFWFLYFRKHLTNHIFICWCHYILHPNNTKFPKALWCVICFTLGIVHVVNYRSIWYCGTHAFWVVVSHILPNMVSTSFFTFLLNKREDIDLGQHTLHILHPHMPPLAHPFPSFSFNWFVYILILCYFLTLTLMSCPNWNVVCLCHSIYCGFH